MCAFVLVLMRMCMLFSDAPVDVEGFLLVQVPVFLALWSKSEKIALIKS